MTLETCGSRVHTEKRVRKEMMMKANYSGMFLKDEEGSECERDGDLFTAQRGENF